MTREQQKVYLTPEARAELRCKAREYGCELSAIIEHLIMHGAYPPEKDHKE